MKPQPMPSMERIFELFYVDFDEGKLLHKKKCGAAEFSVAGNLMPSGYIRVKVDGKLFLSHRLIYQAKYGNLSIDTEIDHIDGDKTNNSISNLRPVTRSQNRQNVGIYNNNSTGFRGVSRTRYGLPYQAQIQKDGVRFDLGTFETPELAAAAYSKAAKELFGEYRRK